MADEEQVKLLKSGVKAWNKWRCENLDAKIDLCGADLRRLNLAQADLTQVVLMRAHMTQVDLQGARLVRANLSHSDLSEANLTGANLFEAQLSFGNLRDAELSRANLNKAKLYRANLCGAKLIEASLAGVSLREAKLNRANLTGGRLAGASLYKADLRHATLTVADFTDADLAKANFVQANLTGAKLRKADLRRRDLIGVNLTQADLTEANLAKAILDEVNLYETKLAKASLVNGSLVRATLVGANLAGTDLTGAILTGANLERARFDSTTLGRLDLLHVQGLGKALHGAPSTIGADTLRISEGRLPAPFLRGCGLADWEIEAAKLYDAHLSPEEITTLLYRVDALRGQQPIQINPLFISYSHSDSSFVEALEKCLDGERIRYWRDVHSLKAGRVESQLERAITLNPCFVLVLSEMSVESDWVEWEASKARELERKLGRDVLCPVSLDDAWKTCDWPGPLRRQIEDYYIVDFSEWRDEERLRTQFKRLREGLQINYPAERATRG